MSKHSDGFGKIDQLSHVEIQYIIVPVFHKYTETWYLDLALLMKILVSEVYLSVPKAKIFPLRMSLMCFLAKAYSCGFSSCHG
jgi:hypothetical protein